jgi:hypothetical protein
VDANHQVCYLSTYPVELDNVLTSDFKGYELIPIFSLDVLIHTPLPNGHNTHTHTHRSPEEEASGRRHQENDAYHQSDEDAAAGWIAFFRALFLCSLSLLICVVYRHIIRHFLCHVMSVQACCKQSVIQDKSDTNSENVTTGGGPNIACLGNGGGPLLLTDVEQAPNTMSVAETEAIFMAWLNLSPSDESSGSALTVTSTTDVVETGRRQCQ